MGPCLAFWPGGTGGRLARFVVPRPLGRLSAGLETRPEPPSWPSRAPLRPGETACGCALGMGPETSSASLCRRSFPFSQSLGIHYPFPRARPVLEGPPLPHRKGVSPARRASGPARLAMLLWAKAAASGWLSGRYAPRPWKNTQPLTPHNPLPPGRSFAGRGRGRSGPLLSTFVPGVPSHLRLAARAKSGWPLRRVCAPPLTVLFVKNLPGLSPQNPLDTAHAGDARLAKHGLYRYGGEREQAPIDVNAPRSNGGMGGRNEWQSGYRPAWTCLGPICLPASSSYLLDAETKNRGPPRRGQPVQSPDVSVPRPLCRAQQALAGSSG